MYGVWDPKITAISTTHQLLLCQLCLHAKIRNVTALASLLRLPENACRCAQLSTRGFVFSVTRVSLVTGGHVMIPYRFTVHVPVRNHATELYKSLGTHGVCAKQFCTSISVCPMGDLIPCTCADIQVLQRALVALIRIAHGRRILRFIYAM